VALYCTVYCVVTLWLSGKAWGVSTWCGINKHCVWCVSATSVYDVQLLHSITSTHNGLQMHNLLSQIVGDPCGRVVLSAVHEEETRSVPILVHDRVFLVFVVAVGSFLGTPF
jgi:uncharacterized protein YhbP (UPF0306 family)